MVNRHFVAIDNFKPIKGKNTKVEFYIFFVLHSICKIKEKKMLVVNAVILTKNVSWFL